jgi:hypothetical protein
VAFLAGALALHPILTPDLWWHLASGRWILANRTIPRADVFSYTMQGHEWINLQWLTDVLFVSLWRWAGPDGLVLLRVLLFALTWVVVLAGARQAQAAGAAAVGAAALGALASAERTLVRPELFTGLGLASTLFLVHRAASGRRRSLVAIPPITLVWTNLHSLAFLGPAAVLLHALLAFLDERLGDRWRSRKPAPRLGRDLLLCGAASSAALLANPYGLAAWTFPFTLLQRIAGDVDVFSRILEFSRPLAAPGDPALRFWWILLAATGGSFLALLPRVPLARLFSIVPFLVLALLARRNIPLFAISAAGVLAVNLTELSRRFPRARPLRAAVRAAVPLAACAFGVAVLLGASPRLLGLWRDRGLFVAPDLFPEECLAALDRSAVRGNLFHDLDFGGYVVWRDPARRSFIDGRLEVAGRDWFARFVEAHEDPRAWERMRASWKLDVLLLQHSSRGSAAFLRSLLESEDWTPLCFSPEAVLLVSARLAAGERAVLSPAASDWERILAGDRGPAPGAGRALAFLTDPLHAALARAPALSAQRRAVRFANLCLTLNEIPAARAGYERVLAVDPGDPEAIFNLGMCDLREGRADRARERWETGMRRVDRASRAIFREALEKLDSAR